MLVDAKTKAWAALCKKLKENGTPIKVVKGEYDASLATSVTVRSITDDGIVLFVGEDKKLLITVYIGDIVNMTFDRKKAVTVLSEMK